MPYLESQLITKKSTLPNAGKGLFTKKKIEKGTRIVEYKGKVTTWKKVTANKIFNGYVYYITRNHVIDAKRRLKTFGRYANDASGLSRQKGITNNCVYVKDGNKVYIESIKKINSGGEILVSYGKDYWDVVRQNNKIDELNTRELKKKK